MSHTQSSVSGTMTAISTPGYCTFKNEADYNSWLAEFSAQNEDSQQVINFRVFISLPFLHLPSMHLKFNHRLTAPPSFWNLDALQILKGGSTLTHVVQIYISSTLSTGTADTMMSQISTSSPTSTPQQSLNLTHSNQWAACKGAMALSIFTL